MFAGAFGLDVVLIFAAIDFGVETGSRELEDYKEERIWEQGEWAGLKV
jgi:hypothetical protein